MQCPRSKAAPPAQDKRLASAGSFSCTQPALSRHPSERVRFLFASLGFCGRRRRGLRACRLSPAEGVEIGPDMLDGLLVEGLDRGLPALRGIDFQLHLTAF